jgi:hypothetical protein
LRQNAVHRVVWSQKKCGFIGVALTSAAFQVGVIQQDKVRGLGNRRAVSVYIRTASTAKREMYVRLQAEQVGLGDITHTYSGSAALRQIKVDFLLGVGIAGVLVEDQAAGFEVNGIP